MQRLPLPFSGLSRWLTAALFLVLSVATSAQTAPEKFTFDIPAGPAADSFKLFTKQSGTQLLFASDVVKGISTNQVRGAMTAREAADQLVSGTPLVAIERNGAIAINKQGPESPNAPRAIADNSDRPGNPAEKSETKDGAVVLDTFEVFGKKTLNMDIPRSKDDVQPYVVFDRAQIERSGASNLQEFVRTQLPMADQSASSWLAVPGPALNTSTVNLRGLGANQTLIMIDGHRTAGFNVSGVPQQPNLNGVPLEAIERIEVLPSTASGIYGGGATGGVVNIILRRNYAGAELKLSYENAFDTDASSRRADLSAGLSLEKGRTNVLLSASYAVNSSLQVRDRDFVDRARSLQTAVNGADIASPNPPLGYTTNIRSSTGAALTLKGSGLSLNSPFTSIPVGYVGVSSDNGAALIAGAGHYNLAPSATQQAGGGGRRNLMPESTNRAAMATIRRDFTDRVSGFIEASAAKIDSTFDTLPAAGTFLLQGSAASNPFNEAIRINTPIVGIEPSYFSSRMENVRLVGGVIVRLPGDWKAEGDYTWVRTRVETATTPQSLLATTTAAVAAGTLNVFRDTNVFRPDFASFMNPASASIVPPTDTSMEDFSLRASGDLFHLPAGPVTLSALAEHRLESFGTYRVQSTSLITIAPQSQRVQSLYLESLVPLFGATNPRWGISRLDLQVAGRGDFYETDGSSVVIGAGAPLTGSNRVHSVNPTVGLKLQAGGQVTLRASYGTGFLPPSVDQLAANLPIENLTGFTPDPRRGNQTGYVYSLVAGGNANLRPEESESWSAGFILEPRIVPNLRFSVDWTLIKKTDNFYRPFLEVDLALESVLPGFIVRAAPTPANDPQNFGVGPIIQVNSVPINASSGRFEFLDFSASWKRETPWGEWTLDGVATLQLASDTQVSAASPVIDQLGLLNTTRWRGNLSAGWHRGPWNAVWSGRYYDSYWQQLSHLDLPPPNSRGSARVPSQFYQDLFLSYRFAGSGRLSGILARTELSIGVKNFLNRPAPIGTVASGTITTLGADPRQQSYQVSLKRSF